MTTACRHSSSKAYNLDDSTGHEKHLHVHALGIRGVPIERSLGRRERPILPNLLVSDEKPSHVNEYELKEEPPPEHAFIGAYPRDLILFATPG